MATGTIKNTYYKREKLVFGNFSTSDMTTDVIYFKISELYDLPPNVTLKLTYLDKTQQDTSNGMIVTNGSNTHIAGFTFDDPYVGGQRSITVRARKTSHGLAPGTAVLNIPPSKAIKVTY